MFDGLYHAFTTVSWVFIGLFLFGAFIMSHAVGRSFYSALQVVAGHGRELMPSLPVAPMLQGSAAVRFHQKVLTAERALLREFSGGVQGAEASGLAGKLNLDEVVVSAALERLREEIPCRMRITRSGRILHDFEAADIATLSSKRRAWFPVRIGVFLLAALANIGAIWPVLLILILALWTLDITAMTVDAEIAVYKGGGGLIAIAVAFAVALGAAPVVGLLLQPWIKDGPTIGAVSKGEDLPNRRARRNDDAGWWVWFGGNSSGSSSGGSSSSSSSSSSSDSDGLAGLGQAIIIIIAIAIIVLCTIAIAVWTRGLWRAISRDDRHLDRTSPAFWVRTAEAIDRFEQYLPTNDLVGRVYGALMRAHSHRRPVDEDLGPRILLLARDGARGRVSTIDIALAEGLDLGEAAEVGSRLCSIVGGEILVSDDGVLVFEFPHSALDSVQAMPDEDMWAEYIDPDPNLDMIKRRSMQARSWLPVNLVGLTHSHLVATDRLAAGTILMAFSGTLLLASPHMLDFQYLTSLEAAIVWLAQFSTPVSLALFLFALGAMCLNAAAHYSAVAVAEHGVRRDIRRATFDCIRHALRTGNSEVDLTRLPYALANVFEDAWPSLTYEFVEPEIEGVLIDLGLSPSLDAAGKLRIPLGQLRREWENARETARTLDGLDTAVDHADDAVVFETEITHDRVKVLA